MRRWFLIGLAAAALLLAAIVVKIERPASEPAASPPLAGSVAGFKPTGRPAPDIAFVTAEGKPATLKDFAGRVVLLNLWATWCAPCVREMPSLDRLQAELGGADFEVVALSSDRSGKAAVEPFFRSHGLSELAIYLDPKSEATRALGARGLPTTLLIDRRGREAGRLEGAAEWDSPEAKALIRSYLGRD